MMLVAGTAAAQQDPPPEATGDLAEVMRGILFPNSNILFDAQSTDPVSYTHLTLQTNREV